MVEKLKTVSKEPILEQEHELYREIRNLSRVPPNRLFKALQSQYLLNRLAAAQQKRLNNVIVDNKDMFRACHLSYEGMKEFKDEVEANIDKIDKNIKINDYKDIISPLGNFIIGYKVIKHYCGDYIDKEIIDKAQQDYEAMKKRVRSIEPEIGAGGLIDNTEHPIILLRSFGVEPRAKKSQPDTLFNLGHDPITDIEQYTYRDAIKEFKERYKGKNAYWAGAKTKAFEKYLQYWKELNK